jgi:hypothetical protein
LFLKIVFRIRFFIFMLALCAAVNSARAAEDEDVENWHFYADTIVHPQADDSFAAVYADFSRLLTRDLKQENAALDENSIRVAPLEDGKPGAFVPVRFVKEDGFDAAKKAIGTIVFQVAETKEPGEQTYRVFFDTQKNGPKAEWKNEVEVPETANMIWNGGFEVLSEGYTGTKRYKNDGAKMPVGWWGNLKNSGFTENPATSAHSGKNALAFTAPEAGKNRGIGAAPSPPALRVVPGENYVFSFWAKGDGLTPSRTQLVSSVYWYDKDGKYQTRTRVGDLPENTADFPWTKGEISLPAPADAHFAALRISTYSATGLITVDDLETRLAVPPALRGAKTNS